MIHATSKNKAYLIGIVVVFVNVQYYLNGYKHFLGLNLTEKSDQLVMIIYNVIMVFSFIGFYWREKIRSLVYKKK